MNKLSKLELCKRIAEIEGVPFHEAKSQNQNGIVTTLFSYNPLTDRALLWDLTIKHGVCLNRSNADRDMWLVGINKDHIVSTYLNIPRTILEVIVEANNG